MDNNLGKGVVRSLVVVPTYRCNAECNDCGTASSPRDKSRPNTEVLLDSIQQAKELGFSSMVVTGGEPSLELETTIRLIQAAHEFGMLTRVVSNGQWATTKKEADVCVDSLVRAGLDEINLSTGDQHAEYVPIENVALGIKSSVEHKLTCHLMVERTGKMRISKTDVDTCLSLLGASQVDLENYYTSHESPWMPNRPETVRFYKPEDYIQHSNLGYRASCDSVLRTYVVQPTGNVLSCCGFGVRTSAQFTIGKTDEGGGLAEAVLKAENNSFFTAVAKYGPSVLVKELLEIKGEAPRWSGVHAHQCQSCASLHRTSDSWREINEHLPEIRRRLARFDKLETDASDRYREQVSGNFD